MANPRQKYKDYTVKILAVLPGMTNRSAPNKALSGGIGEASVVSKGKICNLCKQLHVDPWIFAHPFTAQKNLMSRLKKAISVENQVVFIFFQGHGGLLPHVTYGDSAHTRVVARKHQYVMEVGKKVYITSEEIKDLLKSAKSKVMLIFGSCHSGKAAWGWQADPVAQTRRNASDITINTNEVPNVLSKNDIRDIKRANPTADWMVVSACKEEEVTWHNRSKGSFLINRFCEQMKGDQTYLSFLGRVRDLLAADSAAARLRDAKGNVIQHVYTSTLIATVSSRTGYFSTNKIPQGNKVRIPV